jgi:hypothetical protein
LSIICVDKDRGKVADKWIFPRGNGSNCDRVLSEDLFALPNPDALQDAMLRRDLTGDDLVFTFQFPTPKDGAELYMSELHQSMVSVASMQITYLEDENPGT